MCTQNELTDIWCQQRATTMPHESPDKCHYMQNYRTMVNCDTMVYLVQNWDNDTMARLNL